MSNDEAEGTEVTFNVVVLEDDGIYGVTLYADDGQQEDEDSVPCWRTAFRGKTGADVDEVAEIYADCHQDSMDTVGVEDLMDPDEWLEKMRKSVVLAGEMMDRFGYRMLPTAEVGAAIAERIFVGIDGWPEDPDAPVDIRKMN